MKGISFKSLSFAVFCGFSTFCAAVAASIFSDYGQIQNVQNYSTNPFWSPGSTYNQRMPQPVYVQGADLTAQDCLNVVQPLVSVQCMARDNCRNTSLADIRPTVMLQLSNLPDKNYVSACSGFIDTVFESYVAQYGNNVPNRQVNFPKATQPSNYNGDTIQIQNPYKQNVPEWKKDINERKEELQRLQRQNGAGNEHVTAADFPATYADLSFKSRMELQAEGYEPFKDMKTYVTPDFQTTSDWCQGKGAGSPECPKEKNKRRGGGGTDDEDDEDTLCQSSDPHATKTELGSDGETCIIKECEDAWEPNTAGTKCEEEKVWYELRVFSDHLVRSLYSALDIEDNFCYAVCGRLTDGDDLNEKVLKPILNKSYCVPKIKDQSATDGFRMVGVIDQQPIKFSEKKRAAIAKGLYDISDNGSQNDKCDGKYNNIDAEIWKHDDVNGTVTRVSITRLDD